MKSFISRLWMSNFQFFQIIMPKCKDERLFLVNLDTFSHVDLKPKWKIWTRHEFYLKCFSMNSESTKKLKRIVYKHIWHKNIRLFLFFVFVYFRLFTMFQFIWDRCWNASYKNHQMFFNVHLHREMILMKILECLCLNQCGLWI